MEAIIRHHPRTRGSDLFKVESFEIVQASPPFAGNCATASLFLSYIISFIPTHGERCPYFLCYGLSAKLHPHPRGTNINKLCAYTSQLASPPRTGKQLSGIDGHHRLFGFTPIYGDPTFLFLFFSPYSLASPPYTGIRPRPLQSKNGCIGITPIRGELTGATEDQRHA